MFVIRFGAGITILSAFKLDIVEIVFHPVNNAIGSGRTGSLVLAKHFDTVAYDLIVAGYMHNRLLLKTL